MKIKDSWQQRCFNCFNVLFMLFMIVITLYPMIYILMASFSDPETMLTYKGILLKPLGFTVEAYQNAFKQPLIMRAYGNTIFVVVAGVAVNVFLTAIGAYFLSRQDVLWKRPISFLIVFTMFFSGGLIPFYFTVKDVGLFDSLWSLIIPTAISTYNLMVMRTGFDAIPESLTESATIDGAGHYTMLFKINIPLAIPTIAVIILYYGVAHWNAWFNASLFINTPEKYPLQLVLKQILLINDTTSMTQGISDSQQWAAGETIKYAVIVIATLPILCVYPFLQRYFVKGVMIGAVKG